VKNVDHKGASDSAIRPLAKCLLGRESGERGLAGQQCAVTFRARVFDGIQRKYPTVRGSLTCFLSQGGEAVGSEIGWHRAKKSTDIDQSMPIPKHLDLSH
jgi:hypothetical protein